MTFDLYIRHLAPSAPVAYYIESVAPPGFCNRREVRYGIVPSVGGVA